MFALLTPVWVKGTVVSYERMNPHSVLPLEETLENGQTIEWTVEGPSAFERDRGIELDLLRLAWTESVERRSSKHRRPR